MAWQITDTVGGTQGIADFAAVNADSSQPNHPVGTIVRAKSTTTYGEGEFIYLKGIASTVVGSWVTYSLDDGVTTLLAANAIGPVAISMSANIVATTYGWYQISGKAVGKCLTLFSEDTQVWITGTAGSVDNTSVAGDLVNLAQGASDAVLSALAADFEISRPFVNNITNSA